MVLTLLSSDCDLADGLVVEDTTLLPGEGYLNAVYTDDGLYGASPVDDESLQESLFLSLTDTLSPIPWALGTSDVFRTAFNDKDVAIKCLRPSKAVRFASQRRRRPLSPRFLHEAKLWKGLSNPHVLPFHGLAEIPNFPTPALVSPWMENGDLGSYIRANLPGVNRLQLAKSIVVGISYLHENGVIHGDLHTGNILIDSQGEAKVSDFGLTSFSRDIEANGLGDLKHARFQAPELVLGDTVSPTKACDVYAFASVCYEIFSGTKPYHNLASDVDVVLAVYEGRLPFVQANQRLFDPPNANKLFWDLMLYCWSREPDLRPKMGRIEQELTNVQDTLEGHPTIAQSHL